jgi:hypothetical protein
MAPSILARHPIAAGSDRILSRPLRLTMGPVAPIDSRGNAISSIDYRVRTFWPICGGSGDALIALSLRCAVDQRAISSETP